MRGTKRRCVGPKSPCGGISVYRGGDQFAISGYSGLMGLGLTLAQIPMIAVPLSIAWLGLTIWLGRTHLAQDQQDGPVALSID